jgi:hypothetical protein
MTTGGGFGGGILRALRREERLRSANAYGADAIGAVAQQQSKIIFIDDMGGARLLFAQPAFRRQMLEERMKTGLPLVLAAGDRKATGDLFIPGWIIGKARPSAGRLFKATSGPIFEQDIGGSQSQSKSYLILNARIESYGPEMAI